MAYFLYQWRYKDPAIQAMVKAPQDRPAELRKAVEGFGGRMHAFFYAFGTYDGIAIVEFPDIERCAACSLTLAGAGANAALQVQEKKRTSIYTLLSSSSCIFQKSERNYISFYLRLKKTSSMK